MAAVPFVANELRCSKSAAVSALVTVIVVAASAADAAPKTMLVGQLDQLHPLLLKTDLQGRRCESLYWQPVEQVP